MINILLLSHGDLAKGFLSASELIMGKQEKIKALGLRPDESREDFQKRISEACESLYTDDGILILTDLFGGTPTNAAILEVISKYDKLEILAGINLSILLEAFSLREESLKVVISKLKDLAPSTIVDIREALDQD